MATKKHYVSDSDTSSYEDDDTDLRYKQKKTSIQSNIDYQHTTKCSSRNAIMARENRVKKKLHLQKLEEEVRFLRKENSKLNIVVEGQSCKISKLKKHIRYLGSVLANSRDLQLLMKNIRCCTGMSVTNSLDRNLTLNNDCLPKHDGRLIGKTDSLNIPLENLNSSSEICDFNEDLFPDLRFDLNTMGYNSDENVIGQQTLHNADTHQEHNYTLQYSSDGSADATMENVGVCLHVSKHHVSLEFCASCNEHSFRNMED